MTRVFDLKYSRPKAGLTRRTFLGAACAVGAGAMAGGLPSGPLLAETKAHKFKVGEAELTVVSDGIFSLPRSFILADEKPETVDALLTAHHAPLDLKLETNVVLVRSGKTLALIDTGGGTEFMASLGRLPDALEGIGVDPDAITHVIFTHAHADHLWGAMDPFGDGARWPNARHVITAVERDFWLKDGVENRVPAAMKGMALGIKRRIKTLGDTLTTAKDGEDIAPGIAFTTTPGHTPGHASVVVRSGSEDVIVGGDALTHAVISFAQPSWHWGSDYDKEGAAKTRARLLDRLASSKARLVGYHLPWPGVGVAEAAKGAYRFVPA
ncbi:MAG: MBL fold metallo-hydrolase [Hyphomicrobiaceae bacterium]